VPRELGGRIGKYLMELTRGGFHAVQLSAELAVQRITEAGPVTEAWEPQLLSTGERHQAALAVKIAMARALAEAGGPVFIVLDDSLATFDPWRRTATEDLFLKLVSDGKLQVILLTCHTDWALAWHERAPDLVDYIELGRIANYYRLPPSLKDGTPQ
jgi:uncharacterized protein YhaN